MDYRQELQKADLKVTGARLAVLGYLGQTSKPLDADAIFNHLKAEHDKVDMVTVYRILESFRQKGLITRLEFQEGKFRYEMAGDEHHHLICEQCGGIEDMSDCNITDLEKEITVKKGFVVKRHALEFFGTCTLCQS
jgi:Fe2+ or Zn2+ uptake regulation protein